MLSNGAGRIIHGTWDASGVTSGVIYLSKDGNFAPTALTTTTAGNTTLTTSGSYTTSAILPGDVISGTGIVDGTYVVSIESATSLTMSQAASDSTANSRTFTRAGKNPYKVLHARVISSTSATTMTAARVRANNVTHNHIDLTCVSGDAGYWSMWTN